MTLAPTIPGNANLGEAVVDDQNRGSSDVSGWEVLLGRSLLALLLILFAADWLLQPEKFQIEEIVVHGESGDLGGEQVKNVVKNALDGNFFSISLERLESEVEKLPWVLSASLRRQWPSTIIINVVEAELVARWGTDKWLSFAGEPVLLQANDKLDHSDLVQLNGDLVQLNGHEDQIDVVWEAFQQWSEKFASIGLSLDELSLSSTGLLEFGISPGALGLQSDLYNPDGQMADTDSSVTMIVELENSGMRVRRFLDALDQQFLARFLEMESVDLRYPNGFTISWRDPGAESGIKFEPETTQL